MDQDKRLSDLFNAAGNLLEYVELSKEEIVLLKEEFSEQISKLKHNNITFDSKIDRLNNIIKDVDIKIDDSVERRSSQISSKIASNLSGNFKQANDDALNASDIYNKASANIVYKAVFLSFSAFVILGVSSLFAYKYYIQSYISELSYEVSRLTEKKKSFDKYNIGYLRTKVLNAPSCL